MLFLEQDSTAVPNFAYLAGHESSKITMDIYAKVKYNRPDELVRTMGGAFAQWDAAQA